MRILSIIGTRPQYIKIKPIFDYCVKNKIEHKIADTNQHYSFNVSESIIKDLSLNIDHNLNVLNHNEISFIKNCIEETYKLVEVVAPDHIIVYGDTNSTLVASLVSYKMGIDLSHVEAGLRCHDMAVAEEVNRIFADTVSKFKFCSTKTALGNINTGIYSGDLEYELLNSYNPPIDFNGPAVLTIHRQENMNINSFEYIFSLCDSLGKDVIFPIHHRTKKFLKDSHPLSIPKNIKIVEPQRYSDMIRLLASSCINITDSGGLQKLAPFFGKKTLIVRSAMEWEETVNAGFCKLSEEHSADMAWLTIPPPARNRNFYLSSKMPSEIIINSILEHHYV